MMGTTAAGKAAAVEASSPYRRWALFLDVDGTILDLAPTPDAAVPPPDLLRCLELLGRTLSGALALVSGRSITDLDRLFRPLVMAAAGQHGAEVRASPGSEILRQEAAPIDQSTKAALRGLAREFPDILVEDKGLTVAVHYRQALSLEDELRRRLTPLLEAAAGRYVLLQGKAVFEIKPPGVDKGTALAALMEGPAFHGRVPVFLGDDRTDEDGFREAERLKGMALRVGPGATGAAYFSGPAEVRAWLAALAADREGPAWRVS